MNVNKKRLRTVTEKKNQTGPIVYWMNRDCRSKDNWALLYAQKQSMKENQPLLVVYNLEVGFLGGAFRQHDFKVKGLQEVESALTKKKIPFFCIVGGIDDLLTWLRRKQPGLIVTDFSPLKLQVKWLDRVAKSVDCSVHQVDSHNIIPVWEASDKQEYAARTIRPKIHRKINEFLDDFPELEKQKIDFSGNIPSIPWAKILESFPDKSVPVLPSFVPGQEKAREQLEKFKNNRLSSYGENRNNALKRGQSDLSPYLHYGHIAPQRVVLELLKREKKQASQIMEGVSNGASSLDNVAVFLEELIVRRELAENFCHYNKNYDSVAGFPEWARVTLEKHAMDIRSHVYTLPQFEQSKTHDDLWNAAQRELVQTGKMHGYMRMYWAKKILEWTRSPEQALKFAIKLNDKYSLDGRDPNGYVGVAWSVGGVHDRPWFERPVFGMVRYMAESGVKKRFNIKEYIQHYQGSKL